MPQLPAGYATQPHPAGASTRTWRLKVEASRGSSTPLSASSLSARAAAAFSREQALQGKTDVQGWRGWGPWAAASGAVQQQVESRPLARALAGQQA